MMNDTCTVAFSKQRKIIMKLSNIGWKVDFILLSYEDIYIPLPSFYQSIYSNVHILEAFGQNPVWLLKKSRSRPWVGVCVLVR